MGEIDRYFEEDCNTTIVKDILKKAYELGYQRGVGQFAWNHVDVLPPWKEEQYLIITDDDRVCNAWWTNKIWVGATPTLTEWHWNGVPQFSKVVGWGKLPKLK